MLKVVLSLGPPAGSVFLVCLFAKCLFFFCAEKSSSKCPCRFWKCLSSACTSEGFHPGCFCFEKAARAPCVWACRPEHESFPSPQLLWITVSSGEYGLSPPPSPPSIAPFPPRALMRSPGTCLELCVEGDGSRRACWMDAPGSGFQLLCLSGENDLRRSWIVPTLFMCLWMQMFVPFSLVTVVPYICTMWCWSTHQHIPGSCIHCCRRLSEPIGSCK